MAVMEGVTSLLELSLWDCLIYLMACYLSLFLVLFLFLFFFNLVAQLDVN